MRAYLKQVIGYLLAALVIAIPASGALYVCQVFLLPAFGVRWIGFEVILAACCALVVVITFVRVALTIRVE